MAERPAIERQVRRPLIAALLVANLTGAAIVLVLLRFVLPLPPLDDTRAAERFNYIVFVVFVVVVFPLGVVARPPPPRARARVAARGRATRRRRSSWRRCSPRRGW